MNKLLIQTVLLCLSTSIALAGLLDLQVLNVPNLILQTEQPSNVFLVMNEPVEPVMARIRSTLFPNRNSRATELRNQLVQLSRLSQAGILAVCNLFGVQTVSYWITNRIYAKGVTAPFLAIMEALKTAGLLKDIQADVNIPTLPVIRSVAGPTPNGYPVWNVNQTCAQLVWPNTMGEGVLVGLIDSGARGTHEAIRDNFVGNDPNVIGWYDPIRFSQDPTDESGHGTHCTGVIAGTKGIGMAPKAKWMACKACTSVMCPGDALMQCGQFMTCSSPYPAPCNVLPDIVSNSWGGGSNDSWFNDIINGWNTVGIIGVFAIGNDGPDCFTTNSPGDQDGVIGVASTNISNSVSSFSSRGPPVSWHLKPEISGPGENINSAYFIADNSYRVMSGTSMATPHVSGALALLLSANPNLNRTQAEDYLFSNTFRNLVPSGEDCGGIDERIYPNYVVGYGRVNVCFVNDFFRNI